MVVTGLAGPDEDEIRGILQNAGFRISSFAVAATRGADSRELSCQLQWRARLDETKVPEPVHRFMVRDGVVRVAWTPESR